MKTQLSLHTLTAPSLLFLGCLAASCSGGGGSGGSSTPGSGAPVGGLGAFSQGGTTLSLNRTNATTNLESTEVGGFGNVNLVARDSLRNLTYAIDTDQYVLLRIDAAGNVRRVGPMDATLTPSAMVFDPASGMLLGIQDGGRRRPSFLVRLDPATGAAERLADTIGVRTLTLDSAQNQLLAVTSSGALVAIDMDSGSSQTLFSHVSFPSVTGITFDPMTRLLYAVDSSEPASFLAFDLNTQFVDLVAIVDRRLARVTIDVDSGRFFTLSSGGQVSELLLEANSQRSTLRPMATLSRELVGMSFDPRDGRFFAVDQGNKELVKLDTEAARISTQARLSLPGASVAPDLGSMAYDPMLDRLFAIERLQGDLYSIDPATGVCTDLRTSFGPDARLAIDALTGRIFVYDQGVGVLLELDSDGDIQRILDNGISLTNVRDLAFEPNSQLLVAMHRESGRSGDTQLSSFGIQSNSPSPSFEVLAPSGMTALGLDSRSGRFHGFGQAQPLYEFDLDLSPRPSRVNSALSVGGAWDVPYRAALSVPSRGTVLVIDNERLYEYNVQERSMRLRGNLPSSMNVTDLLFDEATGRVGLRESGTVRWASVSAPFNTNQPQTLPSSSSMQLASDPSTQRIFGVENGLLHRITLGSSQATAITTSARPSFVAEAVAFDSELQAVFAVGRETGRQVQTLVRFDVESGDWSDVGDSEYDLRALFLN